MITPKQVGIVVGVVVNSVLMIMAFIFSAKTVGQLKQNRIPTNLTLVGLLAPLVMLWLTGLVSSFVLFTQEEEFGDGFLVGSSATWWVGSILFAVAGYCLVKPYMPLARAWFTGADIGTLKTQLDGLQPKQRIELAHLTGISRQAAALPQHINVILQKLGAANIQPNTIQEGLNLLHSLSSS